MVSFAGNRGTPSKVSTDEAFWASSAYGPLVHQASGIVSVQASCTFPEAVAMMEALARETPCALDEVAQAVLDRSIRFGGN